MKYCYMIIMILLFVAILVGCLQISETLPGEGLWYCEALHITANFDTGECFAITDNVKMDCAFSNDRGSEYIAIICQDFDCEDHYLGQPIFEGRCIYYSDKEMVIREEETKREYVFLKQEN